MSQLCFVDISGAHAWYGESVSFYCSMACFGCCCRLFLFFRGNPCATADGMKQRIYR